MSLARPFQQGLEFTKIAISNFGHIPLIVWSLTLVHDVFLCIGLHHVVVLFDGFL